MKSRRYVKRREKMLFSQNFNRIVLIVICFFLGILAAVADMLRVQGHFTITGEYCFQALFYACFAFVLFSLGDFLLNKKVYKKQNRNNSWFFSKNLKSFLLVSLIILLCWSPYLILLYPGVMWYDTSNQLLQWNSLQNLFTSGSITDHHPVFDTTVFGLFVDLGNMFGSGDLGIYLFCWVQSIITTCTLSYSLQYLQDMGASSRMCKIILLMYCFFPLFPLYASCMVKDAVFLPIIMLFSIACHRIVVTRGQCLISNRWMCLFILCSVLMALTKKTGLYTVVPVCILLMLAVVVKARIRLLLCVAVVCGLMIGILPSVVFPAFNIQEGGKQEILAIPFQQSARVLRDHKNEVDPSYREVIEKILGDDVSERYNPYVADPVKGYVWDTAKDKYLDEYITHWISGFWQFPVTYIEAFLSVEFGWLALPTADECVDERLMPVYAQGTNHAFFEGHDEIGLMSSDSNNGQKIEKFINWIEHTPVGMVLFSKALWTTWMAVFVLYESFRRKINIRNVLAFSPYIITYCLLWVSPVSIGVEAMRYVVPQVFMLPFVVGAMVLFLRNQEDVNDVSYR